MRDMPHIPQHSLKNKTTMESQTALYSLTYKESKTYLWTAAFVAGNIILPQLCHLVPNGGLALLPIYFFTLIGAYKYGWRVGLATAILSPFVNNALFGMPPSPMLPAILAKSAVLAIAASFAASRFHKATLPLLLGVVLTYQIVGGAAEWLMQGDIANALQDWRIGLPGMALQVLGGWLFINKVLK